MANREKTRDQVQALLPEGETVLVAALCAVKPTKRAVARRVGKDVAVSVGLTAALAVTGFAAVQITQPAPMWMVLTNRRVILFRKPAFGAPKAKHAVFEVPIDEVLVSARREKLRTVIVNERDTGEELVSLNFGMRTVPMEEVMTAAASLGAVGSFA